MLNTANENTTEREHTAICSAHSTQNPKMQKVKEKLCRMEENDIVEKAMQLTDWCGPVVPVLKKKGKSMYMCGFEKAY